MLNNNNVESDSVFLRWKRWSRCWTDSLCLCQRCEMQVQNLLIKDIVYSFNEWGCCFPVYQIIRHCWCCLKDLKCIIIFLFPSDCSVCHIPQWQIQVDTVTCVPKGDFNFIRTGFPTQQFHCHLTESPVMQHPPVVCWRQQPQLSTAEVVTGFKKTYALCWF